MKSKILKTLVIIFLMSLTNIISAQTLTTYNTYEDYVKKNGTVYDEYLGAFHAGGRVSLILKDKGEKIKLKCKTIWGFEYKDKLFRIHEKLTIPCMLVSTGKFCYYENGTGHLDMLSNNSNTGAVLIGELYYYSENISSPISRINLLRFKKTRPDLYKSIQYNIRHNLGMASNSGSAADQQAETLRIMQESIRESIIEYNKQ